MHRFPGTLLWRTNPGGRNSNIEEAGRAVFKGPSKLHEGIYLVYEETNRRTVDFLIDSNQQFTVEVELGIATRQSIFSTRPKMSC